MEGTKTLFLPGCSKRLVKGLFVLTAIDEMTFFVILLTAFNIPLIFQVREIMSLRLSSLFPSWPRHLYR